MLVITRNPGESFMIGDIPVVVQILAVKGRQVRIGVTAPKEIKVLREELIRKDSEKVSA